MPVRDVIAEYIAKLVADAPQQVLEFGFRQPGAYRPEHEIIDRWRAAGDMPAVGAHVTQLLPGRLR